jgi:hypothetical protein
MLKMQIPVIVESVNAKKGDSSVYYADLILQGGSINLQVTAEQKDSLPIGSDLLCIFQMKVKTIIEFNRPSCIFKPVKLLEVKK